jgi:single-strand DNA-binding protein
MNSISLVGRVGRDLEVKFFESGNCVGKTSLAVNRRGKDVPPDWFNIEAWNRDAEILSQYAPKGSLISVTGSLSIEKWIDRETGEQRFKHVVKVRSFTLLSAKRQEEQPPFHSHSSQQGRALAEVPF